MRWPSIALLVAVLGASLVSAPAAVRAAEPEPVTVGLVDTTTGEWHLRGPDGWVTSFYYGNPGDHPMVGDWDCDGVDTPGLYRRSDGFVYLRNSNTQGVADIRFFFGNPEDIPVAGDFDGDGCDTVSIYRPSEGRVFIINELGKDEGGLGAADLDYYFGNPNDQPFAGDFDGDGIDTIGLHRWTTGLVYFRNSHTQGVADNEFYFGNFGDRFVAGDWTGDGTDTPGLYRPSDQTFFFRFTNTQGNADATATLGATLWMPVAGHFGLGGRPIDERSWSIQVVDAVGDVGRFNDIAISEPFGLPIVSYGSALGTAYQELRVARCDDVACTGASTTPLSGAMFESTSISNASLFPIVSFFDPSNQTLAVARCEPGCTSASIETIPPNVAVTYGKYSEAALAADGTATIVASGSHTTDVLVQFPRSRIPGAPQSAPLLPASPWQRQTIDELNEHSRPALALGPDGLARIVVPDEPVGSAPNENNVATVMTYPLQLETCGDPSCTFGLISRVVVHEETVTGDEAVIGGYSARGSAHPSIAISREGLATIAVSWASGLGAGPGLDVVTCENVACTDRSTVRIDARPNAGRFVDLELTADGLPIMAYTDGSGAVRVAQCLDTGCTLVRIATIATPGPGTEVSLTVDLTGMPLVAYYDKPAGNLVVARLE